MKSSLRFTLAMVLLMAFALPVYAQVVVANLSNIQGNVMVSSGGNMVSATAGPLQAGQSIVVGEGGTVTVTTASGQVTLSAGTYSVGASGVVTGAGGAAAVGGGGATAGGATAGGAAAGAAGGAVGGGLGALGGLGGLGLGLGTVGAAAGLQANQNSNSDKKADDIIDPAVSK